MTTIIDPPHVKFDTLHVNLYGIPGTGKTNVAAALRARLGRAGYDVELVQEYARELARQNKLVFQDHQTGERREAEQFVISAEQFRRQAEYDGKVQVVITDSGLFTGVLFAPGNYGEALRSIMRDLTVGWRNIDVLLTRDISQDYTSLGRIQSRAESEALRPEVENLLRQERPDFIEMAVEGADDRLYRLIEEMLVAPAPRRAEPFRP